MKPYISFRERTYNLDKYEQELFNKVSKVSDAILLSWAGYDNKAQWEKENKDTYSRKGLIISNFEDIEENFEALK